MNEDLNGQSNPMGEIKMDIDAYVEAARVLSAKISRFKPTDPHLMELQRKLLISLSRVELDSCLIALSYGALRVSESSQ